jgi:DNA-binding response OmpR family regulator
MESTAAAQKKKQIAIYSDDSSVRASIVLAFATGPALRQYIDRKSQDGTFKIDLFILDGEAAPEGGLGIARQLKDEVFNCPPVLAITGRKEDAWLAAWSKAEASVIHPIDPFTLARTVADLLRTGSLTSA